MFSPEVALSSQGVPCRLVPVLGALVEAPSLVDPSPQGSQQVGSDGLLHQLPTVVVLLRVLHVRFPRAVHVEVAPRPRWLQRLHGMCVPDVALGDAL